MYQFCKFWICFVSLSDIGRLTFIFIVNDTLEHLIPFMIEWIPTKIDLFELINTICRDLFVFVVFLLRIYPASKFLITCEVLRNASRLVLILVGNESLKRF